MSDAILKSKSEPNDRVISRSQTSHQFSQIEATSFADRIKMNNSNTSSNLSSMNNSKNEHLKPPQLKRNLSGFGRGKTMTSSQNNDDSYKSSNGTVKLNDRYYTASEQSEIQNERPKKAGFY